MEYLLFIAWIFTVTVVMQDIFVIRSLFVANIMRRFTGNIGRTLATNIKIVWIFTILTSNSCQYVLQYYLEIGILGRAIRICPDCYSMHNSCLSSTTIYFRAPMSEIQWWPFLLTSFCTVLNTIKRSFSFGYPNEE